MLLVALLVVASIAFCVDRLRDVFGSHYEVSRPGAESLDTNTFNPKRVVFDVFGSPGAVATINYMDEHGEPQRVDDVTLPWSHQLTTSDPTVFADVRAQGSGDFIACRITVNDVVKDERSTHNVNGYISCLDKSA